MENRQILSGFQGKDRPLKIWSYSALFKCSPHFFAHSFLQPVHWRLAVIKVIMYSAFEVSIKLSSQCRLVLVSDRAHFDQGSSNSEEAWGETKKRPWGVGVRLKVECLPACCPYPSRPLFLSQHGGESALWGANTDTRWYTKKASTGINWNNSICRHSKLFFGRGE